MSVGGADPRNRRALDLNEVKLFPPLESSSSAEVLDLADDNEIESETNTQYSVVAAAA